MTQSDARSLVNSESAHADALDAYYEELEHSWTVGSKPDFGPLVVPNGNASTPIHRWFHMKEAYSCDLVPEVCEHLGLTDRESISVLDPFCGCGTTAVSIGQMASGGVWRRASFTGIEANPFLNLVSRTKLNSFLSPPDDFEALAQRVAALVVNKEVQPSKPPKLSTFNNRDYISKPYLTELLMIREAIQDNSGSASEEAIDMARVCIGGAIESATRLRKDGRALRFEPNKQPRRPVDEFLRRADEMSSDLNSPVKRLRGRIVAGDARENVLSPSPGKFDLVIFSPPYPNNIDYTEVYKMELWMLGLVDSLEGFSDQRRQTLRSHASLKFADPVNLHKAIDGDEVARLVDPILRAIPSGSRYAESRRRIVRGYVVDMYSTLLQISNRMKPGGHLVYVVGNSLHGSSSSGQVLIAADILIARLAELAGLEMDEIAIARFPSRRSSQTRFLRESVVFARKPIN